MAPRIACPKCGETFAFNLSAVETDAKRFDPEASAWFIDRGGFLVEENRRIATAASRRVPDGGTISMADVEWALDDIIGGVV